MAAAAGPRMAGAVALVLMLCCALSGVAHGKEQALHEKTFHSDVFELGPGDVTESYEVLQFPDGHIAMRSFFAEVVDENDVSVPLTEVYLHHWAVLKYHVKKGHKQLASSVPRTLDVGVPQSERIAFQEGADPLASTTPLPACWYSKENVLFGAGSETRHTNTTVPPPYGYVTGDPDAIPEGYEETLILNIHGINTIEAVDPVRCLECFCDSYGVSHDGDGNPLPRDYIGGMRCCYDKTHCAVKEGVQRGTKKYSLKYTVTWVDWDETVVPLRLYTIGSFEIGKSLAEKPLCTVEYTVPQCAQGTAINKCVDHHHAIGTVSVGGDLILAQFHQHNGGLGGKLYYKDGPVLCASEPIYGQGTEAGDEAGYLVGTTSCFPEPGTVTVESLKELHLDAYYSNERPHTGVMSLYNLYVADPVTRIKEVTDAGGT